jgi:hypothetical protein
MVSDLMTWHYETAQCLAMHLESDRHFIRWTTARGLNAFSFIAHTIDSRLKIDELVPICRDRRIGCEYGGHVLQLLLPRSHFDAHPEFFPETASGKRNSRGKLCVSNPEALHLISRSAVSYVEQNPECEMLHIWGADVRNGAWCQCGARSSMSPQVQYLKVINTVAEALAAQDKSTPSVIARDLRAYRNLGIPGVSCLTFGMHSALAYPINLETFARGSRNPDFEPEPVLADITRELHPACDMRMADAYRAIAWASSLILDGGGVMRPALPGGRQALSRQTRLARLQAAVNEITTGIEAGDVIVAAAGSQLCQLERIVWEYSREVVSGIRDYLAAAETDGRERHRAIEAALTRIAYAIEQLRAAAPDAGDTWAAYDLEWIRDFWLQALRWRFDESDLSVPGALRRKP